MKQFIFLIAVLLLGCKQSNKVDNEIKTKIPTSNTSLTRKTETLVEAKGQDKKDIILLNAMLSDMLNMANKLKNGGDFHKQIKDWNYAYETSGSITFGHLFDRDKKHLMVSRNLGSWARYMDIFLLEGKEFRLVLSTVTSDMTFVKYRTEDVNGDNSFDFSIEWYPSSGCCRRNIYDVYLYQKDKGNFTSKYQFVNPTFSSLEKVIRGVNYGHPGEVPLYKYKWNGLHVDTLEYIYPAETIKKKFYRVSHYGDYQDPKKRHILNSVPKEYLKTEGYSWFIDYEIEKFPKKRKVKGV